MHIYKLSTTSENCSYTCMHKIFIKQHSLQNQQNLYIVKIIVLFYDIIIYVVNICAYTYIHTYVGTSPMMWRNLNKGVYHTVTVRVPTKIRKFSFTVD